MNLVAESLGLPTIVIGWILLLAGVIWSLKTAPWCKIEGDKGAQHVLLAFVVIVFFIWQFSASIDDGISFHFLLMTLLTLMFAPQFAILGMVLALIGVTFQSDLGWLSLGINATVIGLIPIAITWGLYKLGARFLEANFFVYIFYNGFFSAAVGVVVALMAGAGVMLINDVHSYEVLNQSFLPYIPLMATPEGFVNGMVLAALIVLKPGWISTFHDSTYLKGK